MHSKKSYVQKHPIPRLTNHMDINKILLELKKKTQILERLVDETKRKLINKEETDQIKDIKKKIDSSYAE